MKFDISKPPTPDLVRAARDAAGLTQDQAAQLVHRTGKKRWSEWETGERQMQLATFELFCIKAKLPIKTPKVKGA